MQHTIGTRRPHRAVRAVLGMGVGIMMAVGVVVCTADTPPAQRASIPRAEFLLAAGDSTYWVHSDGGRIRVRSAPVLLTVVDGALVEIFLRDDGAEYADASFLASQLWARPLRGTDSIPLFADSAMSRALSVWRRRFPAESELSADDESAVEDPATVVHDELDLLDVHGPYLTVERRYDADIAGGPPHVHTLQRFVLDVRTGKRQTLTALFGAVEGTRIEADARTTLGQMLDSIRSAGSRGDARVAAARATLGSFRFEPTSFAITDIHRAPAVEFLVTGRGERGDVLTLRLPAIPVVAPSWWSAVDRTLPWWSTDSLQLRWTHAPYAVRAHRDPDDQWRVTIASTDSTSAGIPVGTVEGPVYQVMALDAPALDSASRSALAKTFDAATMLDAGAEQASFRQAPPRRGAAPAPRGRPFLATLFR